MALATSTIVAIAAVVAAGASAVVGNQTRKDAAGARGRAENATAAQRAAEAANEKRKLIREGRVKKARILQASENTGTGDSSGEFGALGGMSTQLGTNLGFNAGTLMRGRQAAGDLASAFKSDQEGQKAAATGAIASSIFSAAGGFSAFTVPSGTTPQPANTGFGTGSNYGNQDYGSFF
jgi:hypothetical protein